MKSYSWLVLAFIFSIIQFAFYSLSGEATFQGTMPGLSLPLHGRGAETARDLQLGTTTPTQIAMTPVAISTPVPKPSDQGGGTSDSGLFGTVVGVGGALIGLFGLLYTWYLNREHKRELARYDYLFKLADHNIDKQVTESQIKQLASEAKSREDQLKELDERIKTQIPLVARATFSREQVEMAQRVVMEAFERWQQLRRALIDSEAALPALPVDISKAIEEQLQPAYLQRQRSAQLEFQLGVAGTITALVSVFRDVLTPFLFALMIIPLGTFTLLTLVNLLLSRMNRVKREYYKNFAIPMIGAAGLLVIGLVSLLAIFLTRRSSYFSFWYEDPLPILISYGLVVAAMPVFAFAMFRWNKRYANLRQLVKSGRLDDAIARARADLAEDPDNQRIKWQLASMFLKKGDTLAAVQLVCGELQKRPGSFVPWRSTISSRMEYLVRQIEDPQQGMAFLVELQNQVRQLETNEDVIKLIDRRLKQVAKEAHSK